MRTDSGLAIGITEDNVNLISPAPVPAAFSKVRDDVAAMRPALFRMNVDWKYLQPDPSRPAILDAGVSGCMRTIGPCAPFQGITAQLKAIAARQKEGAGWNVLVNIYGVPDWAATKGGGCERPSIEPFSRAINADGLAAYEDLIVGIARLADRTGAELRFWAPWNEPNQIFFISPQRARCDVTSPLLSPAVYTRIFERAKHALEKAGGTRDIVLGDLAGSPKKGKRAGTAAEFLSALPDDVICAADVLALHSYPGNGFDVIPSATAVTDARDCGKRLPVWITETGAGDPRASKHRDDSPAALKEQCRRYDEQLRVWSRNPRVKVAVQYTVREDPAFRVGLVNSTLDREYPSFDLIRAWSRARPGTPPQLPASCR
ncbi:MAG TPA: glycosyl hydrolase [Baekduia sp.]|nr:glycosyl hydrolase [Baekduia sp.]